ncbi:MAG TPA: right-handed parallel beta-helix repeat-containing protein [Polyangiaceae bacterium]
MRCALAGLAGFLVTTFATGSAVAAVIQVGPGDSYTKIEGAQPGDEVVIAPGTYTFRVFLTQVAPANSPIHIHAQDPANPPVWDMGATLVEDAPGSYGGGDKGRGCWQISGGTNYLIEGIVFQNCRTSDADSAGIRYYEGASITVRDCVFRNDDNGMTGGTQNSTAVVEYCEFDHNGNAAAPTSAPTHNLYIYGGTFTLRYSWVHDALQGQNFHVRAQQATLESNWFARAASYEGDLMTDDDYAGGSTFTQSIVLRGNVFFEGSTQSNDGQIFVLYNDTKASGLTMSAHLLYNTFVGDGNHPAFVHLSNADGTPMTVRVDDNVVAGTSQVVLVEDATHGTVSGTNNWIQAGAAATGLTASATGSDPGFVDASAEDYHLAPGSACIGAASSTGIDDLPTTEYWENEVVTRLQRARAGTHDIGAFESTTNSTVEGPYGPVGDAGGAPGSDGGAAGGDAGSGAPDAGISPDGGAEGSDASTGAVTDDGRADGGTGGNGNSGGCGCRVGAAPAAAGGMASVLLLLAGLTRRRGSQRRAPLAKREAGARGGDA